MDVKDGIKALERLRNEIRLQNIGWAHQCAEVGDFSYASNPRIWTWGEGAKLYIGKFCSIGANVQFLLGGEHHTEWITTYPFNVLLKDVYPSSETCAKTKGDIRIGNDVWIGNDAKILSGVTIGNGAVIASSAVVTEYVEPYTVVGGVPAKFIKDRVDPLDAVNILITEWWDWPMEKLAAAIPLLTYENVGALIEFDKRWSETHG